MAVRKPDLREFANPLCRDKCRASLILDALAPDQRKKAKAAMLHGDIAHAAIARVFRTWGHSVTEGTIRKHRRGECCCLAR